MPTVNEMRAATSKKYVTEQGVVVPLQCFWSHSHVFALEENNNNANCFDFFTTKLILGGYFQ